VRDSTTDMDIASSSRPHRCSSNEIADTGVDFIVAEAECEPERLSGFKIESHLKSCSLLHSQICGLITFQNSPPRQYRAALGLEHPSRSVTPP